MTAKVQKKIFAVGLTGGIGSGKTEVGKIFESFGVKLIRADLVARDLIDSNPEIKRKIIKAFGQDIYMPGGKLDRSKMGRIVFHNENLKNKLNHIVHPFVINFIDAELKRSEASKKYPLIVVEAALIFEAGTESSYDYIIVVDSDDESRIKRLMERDHTTRREIIERFKAQLPQGKKIEGADFVIQNNDNLKSLREKCSFVFSILSQLSTVNPGQEVQ